ncbi:MAG: glycoside hydrolase 43 family protein [Bacteroidota bacterium]|nr:glycoside hydrolase 43 family protein [Bacteroidota bacterium]
MNIKLLLFLTGLNASIIISASSQNVKQLSLSKANTPLSKVWVADNGDGTYKNPIIHSDYSDPDVIRVEDDFYLVASSFNCVPGIPILHSKDLVNWELIGHVFAKQPPFDLFKKPLYGKGVWAPSLRYHHGSFYIYYPDPDLGIYMVKAKNPAGPWSEPLLIKEVKGWIDPCPFWDEDGQAYLVNGLAASRSGNKSTLLISQMSTDGTHLISDPAIVFDGHAKHPTMEGPKMYKHDGYYYLSAPAGGVGEGWQVVMRSKNVYGPYEDKITLQQGNTSVNGPHQGGWVDTKTGEYWFIHFQDKGAYGRILHLQPMKWVDGWPVMGVDNNHDGIGEPVMTYRKPNVGKVYPKMTIPESDEFSDKEIGKQWQWMANPEPLWALPAPAYGYLRMPCIALPDDFKNFTDVPNLLMQKFPAPEFTATTKVTFTAKTDNEKAGLMIMGFNYAYLSVTKKPEGLFVTQSICIDADKGTAEKEITSIPVKSNTVYLKVKVMFNALCQFSFSEDGIHFTELGENFTAKKGQWIGAKIGLFSVRVGKTYETGYADFDWFRVE